jgi:hypothetical protein
LNVTPHIWGAVGVNAFGVGGGASQRAAALVNLVSTLALTTGWIVLLTSWATR